MSEPLAASSPTSGVEAHNAHGLAISQLVSPPTHSTPAPLPPSSPPPPPPGAASTSTSSASPAPDSIETKQKVVDLPSPLPREPIEGEAILQAPPGQAEALNGLPTSDARSEKMDVDSGLMQTNVNGQGMLNGVSTSTEPLPLPTTPDTADSMVGQQAGSLKRPSPEDASRDERSPKRVKDEEDGREQGMQVDTHVEAPEMSLSTQAPPPPPEPQSQSQPPASSQDAPASSSSTTQLNGSQPDPTHPVSDPALLPPQNLYLPGTYLPPSRPPLGSTAPLTYPQYRSLMSLIKSIKKQKDSFAFVVPVDPVALNIPHYFSIIQHPMDLGTVEQKLAQSNPAPAKSKGPGAGPAMSGQAGGPYRCVADVVTDVRQVWMNTRIFNGPQHVVSLSADRLEDMFESQLEKLKLNENVSGQRGATRREGGLLIAMFS
jgi:bromodomain-containing factor 1